MSEQDQNVEGIVTQPEQPERNNNMIALAVTGNGVATIVGGLFQDIDFSGIASAVDAIANREGKLSDEEIVMANDIVDQWNTDIVKRLKNKGTEMLQFIDFFEIGSSGSIKGGDLFTDIGEQLAKQTNTVAEYQILSTLLDELDDIRMERPTKPELDDSMTGFEKLQEEQKYAAESQIYKVKVIKKEREITLAENTWKKLLKQDKEVKEMIRQARKYNKELGTFTQLCGDKAKVAKLNITVSDKTVRDSLRELLDFTITV